MTAPTVLVHADRVANGTAACNRGLFSDHHLNVTLLGQLDLRVLDAYSLISKEVHLPWSTAPSRMPWF